MKMLRYKIIVSLSDFFAVALLKNAKINKKYMKS